MDEERDTLEPGVTAVEMTADKKSLLDQIKANRDERGEDYLTLDIPTWEGDLRARYRVVDRAEVDKMIRRIRTRANGAPQSGSEADIDFLINACVEVIAYDRENDMEVHVSNGYDAELARTLEQDPDNIRALVGYMFKFNGIALAAHGQKIARWMQDTSKPVEDPQ